LSPITHFLVGWLAANSAELNPRERACVTLAGVIPDVDGLGLVAEVLTFYLAWKRGFPPLEIFSSRANQAFVDALRRRFQRQP
jgi:hypothetical protein